MPPSNFTLPYYLADCVGDAFNCQYNTELRARSIEEIKAAVAYDHVNIKFKGSYRSVDNFDVPRSLRSIMTTTIQIIQKIGLILPIPRSFFAVLISF